ncbi:MAG: hypothetical protein KC492_10885, partial [Myxococcales bacterium]|nr:hypothetical protein [Myxococcales bacterium]
MDKALELCSDGDRRFLHVEVVVDPSRLPRRIHEYASLLVMSLDASAQATDDGSDTLPPVKSVALLLSGRAKAWPPIGELRTSWPDPEPWTGHKFQIEPVYQRTVDEMLSRPGVFWLVFAPICMDATAASMRHVVEEMRRREANETERAELYAAMLVVAELNTWGHNLGEELRAMMRDLDHETIMQSRTLREAFETGVKKGIAKG